MTPRVIIRRLLLQSRVIVHRDDLFPRGGGDPIAGKYGELLVTLPYVHPEASDGDWVRSNIMPDKLQAVYSFNCSQLLMLGALTANDRVFTWRVCIPGHAIANLSSMSAEGCPCTPFMYPS